MGRNYCDSFSSFVFRDQSVIVNMVTIYTYCPCNYTNGTQWIVNENLPLFKFKGCSSLSNEKKNGL